ncbi:MAG: LysR family transcriptional regulator [Coriobacteriia bacterium]|nr:LysR family transcriptional regulator [Coriobacteriia bacterium]
MLYDYRLDAFVAAAQAGSFTKAAQLLTLSPTALLKQVRALEATCGTPLFTRSSQGAALTPAGQSLLDDARSMMRLSDDALRRVRMAAGADEGLVRLGVSVLRPGRFVLTRWQQIHDALPGLRLELVPISDVWSEYRAVIGALGTQVDVVASTYASDHGASRSGGAYNVVPLGEAPILAAVARTNPLASRAELSLDDLAGQRVTMLRRVNAPIDRARDLIEEHGGIEVEDEADFELSTFNACADAGGILITNGLWPTAHPGLVRVPIAWDATIPYGLLYPLEPSPAVARLVAWLREHVGEFSEGYTPDGRG